MAAHEPPLLPVAILAGGLATRLRPSRETIPEGAGRRQRRPFIARQLEFLRARASRASSSARAIWASRFEDVVGDGAAFGLRVDWAFDGPTLLGTAGALKRALPLLGEPFFVLYGDSYLPIAMAPVQEAFAREREARADDGLPQRQAVRSQQRRVRGRPHHGVRQAAPDAADAPHRLRPGVFDRALPSKTCPTASPRDLADALPVAGRARRAGRLTKCTERFYEIGSFEGLQATRDYLSADTAARTA